MVIQPSIIKYNSRHGGQRSDFTETHGILLLGDGRLHGRDMGYASHTPT